MHRPPPPAWGSRAVEGPAAAPARPSTIRRTAPAPGGDFGSACSSPSSAATAPRAPTAASGATAGAALRRRPLLLGTAALGLAVDLLATVHAGQSVAAAAAGPRAAARATRATGSAHTTGAADATRATRTTGSAHTTGTADATRAARTAGTAGAARTARATCTANAAGPTGTANAARTAGATGSRRLLHLTAELLALVGAGTALPELLTRCGIAIGDALAMGPVMLPAPVGADVGTIVGAVDVCRPAGIDVHIAARSAIAPVPVAEHGTRRSNAHAPRKAGQQGAARWVVGRRIGRVGPLDIGCVRIVGGHVDDLRIGRL